MDDTPDATFRRHLAEGRFMIQRSTSTGRAVFPPRVMVPGSGEQDLEWTEASGRGVLHSFTVVPQKPPRPNYNICLVDLSEGPRVLGRMIDVADDDIAIGAAVETAIDNSGEAPVLVFRPAGDAK